MFWTERTFEEHLKFKKEFITEELSNTEQKEKEGKEAWARAGPRSKDTFSPKQNKEKEENDEEKKITNKRYIYLSPSGFLQVVQLCSKPRALQARIWLTEIYFLCFNLVSILREKIIDVSKQKKDENIDALNSMYLKEKELKKKYKEVCNQKDIEIKNLNLLINNMKKEHKKELEKQKDRIEALIVDNKTKQEIIDNLESKKQKIKNLKRKKLKIQTQIKPL